MRACTAAMRDEGVMNSTLTAQQNPVRPRFQVLHNDEPSAALALWACVVPEGAMQYPLRLGRGSWMCFDTRIALCLLALRIKVFR